MCVTSVCDSTVREMVPRELFYGDLSHQQVICNGVVKARQTEIKERAINIGAYDNATNHSAPTECRRRHHQTAPQDLNIGDVHQCRIARLADNFRVVDIAGGEGSRSRFYEAMTMSLRLFVVAGGGYRCGTLVSIIPPLLPTSFERDERDVPSNARPIAHFSFAGTIARRRVNNICEGVRAAA